MMNKGKVAVRHDLWIAVGSARKTPMLFHHWFAFVAACSLMLTFLGLPLFKMSYAYGRRRNPAADVVTGVALDNFNPKMTYLLGCGPMLVISLLTLILTSFPALSFEFVSDSFINKVNEELVAANRTWKFQKHDCGILIGSNVYSCRNNLENSIEIDSVSNNISEKANEVVLIWNGVDIYQDSFAYTFAVVTKLCSPEKNFNDVKKEISTILPRSEERSNRPEDIPIRSIIIGSVEYTAKVQPNGFLMITVKDKM